MNMVQIAGALLLVKQKMDAGKLQAAGRVERLDNGEYRLQVVATMRAGDVPPEIAQYLERAIERGGIL